LQIKKKVMREADLTSVMEDPQWALTHLDGKMGEKNL